MRKLVLILTAVAILLSAGAFAGQGKPTKAKRAKRPPNPAFAKIKDDAALPRVLLIGDSISIGYTVAVRERLKGKANVHRIPTNGGPTTKGLAELGKWLGEGKWDVIHFNWGLHDLKQMPSDNKHQVSLEQYEKNLRTLARRLKKTRAKLIWASTTPVPEGELKPPRRPSDVIAYNAVALKIMRKNKVAVDDLYSFARRRLAKIQIPKNVHFTKEGSQVLATQVAASIEAVLAGKPVPKP